MALRRFFIPGLLFLLITGFLLKALLFNDAAEPGTPDDTRNKNSTPRRIVSLAPSITEFLYALELENHIAAVTRFCTYPPEASKLPQIGGFLDPNYEAVVHADPDLVILLTASSETNRHLHRLGIKTVMVDHRTLTNVIASAETIGNAAGVPERGKALAASLQERLDSIEAQTGHLEKPRVLLTIEREMQTGTIDTVCIAGRDDFYSAMIEAAGGKNAFPNPAPAFPQVSAEGIIRMNPDIIIELCTDPDIMTVDSETIRKDWQGLSRVQAVRKGAIHILKNDFLTIPGPRFIRIVELLSTLLHPQPKQGRPL